MIACLTGSNDGELSPALTLDWVGRKKPLGFRMELALSSTNARTTEENISDANPTILSFLCPTHSSFSAGFCSSTVLSQEAEDGRLLVEKTVLHEYSGR